MRIPLAPAPSGHCQELEPVRGREVAASWKSWVASECPRDKPSVPPERLESSASARFAGHPIPPPYRAPFDQ